MKKMNKLTIALAFAALLIIASSATVLAAPSVDLIPDLPTTCEVGAGLGGLIERLFPRLSALIQSRGCVIL